MKDSYYTKYSVASEKVIKVYEKMFKVRSEQLNLSLTSLERESWTL